MKVTVDKRTIGYLFSTFIAAAAVFFASVALGESYFLFCSLRTSPGVIGYNIYVGGSSRTYTNLIAVGNVTNATISGLLPGATYFFAATAVDSGGMESPFSNELSYQFPFLLVVFADNQSRSYGAANPTLTGTVTGLQNGDNITAIYTTVADTNSLAGRYAIVPTLVDPGGKLTNYTVTINNGVLTITPQPPTGLRVITK